MYVYIQIFNPYSIPQFIIPSFFCILFVICWINFYHYHWEIVKHILVRTDKRIWVLNKILFFFIWRYLQWVHIMILQCTWIRVCIFCICYCILINMFETFWNVQIRAFYFTAVFGHSQYVQTFSESEDRKKLFRRVHFLAVTWCGKIAKSTLSTLQIMLITL